MNRRAFSLLEVILALAILSGAIAVLGELARQGLENTRIARELACAQLICESKMAEIVAGAELPETVQGLPVETIEVPGETGWLYSIEVSETGQPGLISVAVTVVQDIPSQSRPVQCTLVRWMLDPSLQWASLEQDTESSGASSSSGGGQNGS